MLQFVSDHADEIRTHYGNVSAASVGAIQRGLLTIEQQGGDKFFGEPALNLQDLLQTGDDGRGRDQYSGGGQADAVAEAVCDVSAVAAVGAV